MKTEMVDLFLYTDLFLGPDLFYDRIYFLDRDIFLIPSSEIALPDAPD